MTALDILTDRNWQLVAEDMFTEGAWPTLATTTYDTWPVAKFEPDQRVRGTLNFGRRGSASSLPYIAYEWKGTGASRIVAMQRMTTDLIVEVKIAAAGPNDVDGVNPSARNQVELLWGQMREVFVKQNYQSDLTQGACGFGSTTVVRGRGTGGDISGVYPIIVSDPVVIPSVKEAMKANQFSKDVWTATGQVRFTVWHN